VQGYMYQKASKLRLEATARVPLLTGPEWITKHTTVSLLEAYALMRCVRNADLVNEMHTRVAGLRTRAPGEYQQP